MEKDQSINIEEQVNEPEEITPEERINDIEKDPSEVVDKIKEITPEERINDIEKDPSEVVDKIKEITPEEKILELEDKVARAFAEMENQRRRFEKEREDAFNYGGFSFAKETLNLIDNLERSKQILENDEALKNSEALKKTLEHFDIINKNMVSILSKNGIIPIDTIGKKLDPNLHQAMLEIDDDQKEPGSIVQEIQKGFMMKDRLLRPSLVGVSKKSENKEIKSEENKENLDN
jgi:molecular chaperone GrpE